MDDGGFDARRKEQETGGSLGWRRAAGKLCWGGGVGRLRLSGGALQLWGSEGRYGVRATRLTIPGGAGATDQTKNEAGKERLGVFSHCSM